MCLQQDKNRRYPVDIGHRARPQGRWIFPVCTDARKLSYQLLLSGDNGIEPELRVWIEDPEKGTAKVISDIILGFWKSFKQNGITIPFSQCDRHMIDNPV